MRPFPRSMRAFLCLASVACAYGTSGESASSALSPDASTCTDPSCELPDSGYSDAPAYESSGPDSQASGADSSSDSSSGADTGTDGETPDGGSPDTALGRDSAFPDVFIPPPDVIIPPPDVIIPPPTDACMLSIISGIPACDSCLATSCCTADEACGSDPSCFSYISCIEGCLGIPLEGGIGDASIDRFAPPPDPDAGACMSTCGADYPTGASEFNALNSCIATSCAAPCSGP